MSSSVSIPREPEMVMKQRDGSVLGKKTIIKSDHFPGCQNKRLLPHIEGAPNYRKADAMPVHGVAIPTTDGIRNVLDLMIGTQGDGQQTRILWINLREEPVVYINGRPFVLRDVEKPFSNVEYTVRPFKNIFFRL
ncbi:protein phosphatase [Lithospermum erythrorhizon]|uniref:Protein phosphatase n=1 Tax=Lithospermum erythrorhizon TaxID=34254 RepID=A0AAV3RM65_LITER